MWTISKINDEEVGLFHNERLIAFDTQARALAELLPDSEELNFTQQENYHVQRNKRKRRERVSRLRFKVGR